ncbi:MAG TPA: hypothetical protein VGK89_03870 [Candidatus Eisenbacteria bacterium]|jgi:hypothetical protein
MRARSDTTPKSKIRAEISAGARVSPIGTVSEASATVIGGFRIWIAWASLRVGPARSGAWAASSSSTRSSRIS